MKIHIKAPLLAAVLIALSAPFYAAFAERDGGGRDGGDEQRPIYLNILTQQAIAEFRLERSCRNGKLHRWGQRDASGKIRQWLDEQARAASHRICIRLDNRVAEVRIKPLGGHCGYGSSTVAAPDDGAVLRRSHAATATVSGCRAAFSDTQFGGIALRFADGFGMGDSYVAGVFYSVYDAFGKGRVAPVNEPIFRISDYNTHHFRVEILDRRGRPWSPTAQTDQGGR